MNIIYNYVDISEQVQVLGCAIEDVSGGRGRRLELAFSEPTGGSKGWVPVRGDTLQVQKASFDSGIMFLEHAQNTAGRYDIRATAAPPEACSRRTKIWKGVSILGIAGDMAARHGLVLKAVDILGYPYDAVSQVQESDLAFLNRLCLREGYAFRLGGGMLLLYDERAAEKRPPWATIWREDVSPDYGFDSGSRLLSAVTVVHCSARGRKIQQTARDQGVVGKERRLALYCREEEEARRFAASFLRGANKHKAVARLSMGLETQLQAGHTLKLSGFGQEDGVWFTERVGHDFLAEKTALTLRRPLPY